mmetsp:Transcript_114537/g.370242  ORF Transcript_114537/g.370242 Transcript_114537/m.370242 type:complete len:100 (+) Transcript_114537:1607-1906(+)
MLRSISIIQHLRMMVAAILSSMISLSWALILLLMLIYLFAIFIMQGVLQSLQDEEELPWRSESALLRPYLEAWIGATWHSLCRNCTWATSCASYFSSSW